MVVFVDELAESAVIMGLRVWVATESYWAVKWRLNQKIKEEFDANGIVIPYKHRKPGKWVKDTIRNDKGDIIDVMNRYEDHQ